MERFKKNTILAAQNLSVGYPLKKDFKVVVSDINLEIEKGKLITVLGKNGIGKSTLLRTFSRVQTPISGTVLLHGENIEKLTQKELSTQLSLVLTERLPESQLTVYEIIALGRQPSTNWIDNLSTTDLEKI